MCRGPRSRPIRRHSCRPESRRRSRCSRADGPRRGRRGGFSWGRPAPLSAPPRKRERHRARAGDNWDNISSGLPKDLWVSRVISSKFDEAAVYVTLNGYRWDNFESYVYRSTNYGKSWTRIGLNLPPESVNVIKEDTDDKNILYLGTDAGVYVSIDKGINFIALKGGLPNVPVHDLVLHPTAKELIIGTHGRSIYVADISLIQKYKSLANIGNLHILILKIQITIQTGETEHLTGIILYQRVLISLFLRMIIQKLKIEILTNDSLKIF